MSAAPSAADANARPSIETLEAILDVTYTWGYQETRQQLRNLYDKATHAQWDATAALPWNVTASGVPFPVSPSSVSAGQAVST